MALTRGQLDDRFGIYEVPSTKTRTLSLDFETYSDLNLKTVGLDLYSSHPSFEVLMAAYSIDGGPVKHWDRTEQKKMPRDLWDALHDEAVEIWAFNAQFERTTLNRALDIWPTIRRFKCSMVLAYMHSFVGGLDRVAAQMGIEDDKQKLATGTKLINMFCSPQKLTGANKLRRFTADTHPVEWQMFCEYNRQDVVAELAVKNRLHRKAYPIPKREWDFYALDQKINDRGLPIDRLFVERALEMATKRKEELLVEMRDATGLANPGSVPQLLPWLQERGYPFDDLQKNSIKKVLTANAGRISGELKEKKGELFPTLTEDCVAVLKMRQQQSRTTPTKYAALLKAMGDDKRMRYVFQFDGASRTGRFAGRRFQPQNLTTMRLGGVDDTHHTVAGLVTDAIRQNDRDAVEIYRKEPLDALAGLVRSSVRAKKGKHLLICDLSSIESVVIGWVTGCERLLNVFRDGRDAYKDFATELFGVPYEEVTSAQRKIAKPPTLGAGYRLGGGNIMDGKKTGLWGYAENMGVDMTRKEAHKGVATFRRVYPEIPQMWYALEEAIMKTIRRGVTTTAGPITFSYAKPYLVCHLPSGRNIYYLKPRVTKRPFEYVDSKTNKKVRTVKDTISYMGKQQNGNGWIRVYSHGGKFIENIVQAIARDILREGLMRADEDGFDIIGHVHDEIICEQKIGDNYYSLDRLKAHMISKIKEYPGMPLNAAGDVSVFYTK